ncbi:CPBP family intramembrane glutamic endopeptidase [Chryseobacterium gambrini]|uniref:CPBP family intramembrane glutamic endopeptidase n=1 Tax=Chryseobacterium gambrini TaxID=373672 RepID=UPI0025B31BAA|nr:CPBP family intramembrane glutamic endopeptidase [Chryseobacterium gambrini]MDN4029399.1 CPBP family intramembrane metalloprotease [Chryseobacterium gambrini]
MNYFLRFKHDISAFLQFMKKPDDVQTELSSKRKLQLISNLLIIEIVFFLIVVLPLNYLAEKCITLKPSEAFENLTWLQAVFLMVIFAPFSEEFIFRYVLRYKKFFSHFISREKWNRIFPFLVYISSIIFGLVHLDNYVNDSWIFYALSPFIVASQLSGGLILSYIRVRLNIFYSMLYHALWNLLFGISIPCIMLLFTSPFAEKTQDYDIRIEQKAFIDHNEPVLSETKIVDDRIHSVETRQYLLQSLLDHLYGKDKLTTDEGLMNIHFKSEKGISKDEFLKVLQKGYKIKKVKTD